MHAHIHFQKSKEQKDIYFLPCLIDIYLSNVVTSTPLIKFSWFFYPWYSIQALTIIIDRLKSCLCNILDAITLKFILILIELQFFKTSRFRKRGYQATNIDLNRDEHKKKVNDEQKLSNFHENGQFVYLL